MALEQLRSKRGQIPGLHIGGRVDAIPRQRVVFILLAGFAIFIAGWHHDIRRHAFALRTAAVNTIELLDGVLDGTQRRPLRTQHLIVNTIQRAILLYRPFTEGRFANDQRAAIVLHRCGEDLRRRGAKAVNQHHQRPFVINHAIVVAVFAHFAIIIPHLHHRTGRNKQTRERYRLCQRSAAVAAQVNDDAADVLFFQLLQLHFHVIGQANVKAWNIQHADFFFPDGFHRHLHRTVFQTNALAGQRYNTRLGSFTGRQDFKTNLAALRPFNQRHDVIQTPADDINHRLPGLANANDAIADADRFAFRGWTARHQRINDGIVIIHLQHGADPLE